MTKPKLITDGYGGEISLKKVADMCRVSVVDRLGNNNDKVVIMLSEKKLDLLMEKLQEFKKNNFV